MVRWEIDSDTPAPCFSLVVQIPESGQEWMGEQALIMTTLEPFKQVRTSVAAEVQSELFQLMSNDSDAAIAGGWGRRKGC